MRKSASNSDRIEPPSGKSGRKLIFTFSSAPDPELDKIEFRFDEESDSVTLEREAPILAQGFKWGPVPKAFCLLFLDYAVWQAGDATFVFPRDKNEERLAVSIGDDRYKEAGLTNRLFIEKRAPEVTEHVAHALKITTKSSRPRVVRIRSKFLPSSCVEIFVSGRGKLDTKEISDLAQRIRNDLALYRDLQGQDSEPALAHGPSVSQHSALRTPALPAYIQTLIAEKTRDFIGRDYVFKEIDSFLASARHGYFHIQGKPGEGKTTILAEFVKRQGCPAYFNVHAERRTGAEAFANSLFEQLCHRFAGQSQTPAATLSNDLSELLRHVNLALPADERLVVVVDALDEVETANRSLGENILRLPSILPERVFFVVSSRQGVRVPLYAASLQTLNLGDFASQSLEDIRGYIRHAAGRRSIKQWLETTGKPETFLVQTLAEKSEGNFMYVSYVLFEIESGKYGDVELSSLPKGLENYYDMHWERMGMTKPEPHHDELLIIYVLSQVRAPVSLERLANFTRLSALKIQKTLDDWSQFLHKESSHGEVKFSIYHRSFSEFLERVDIVRATGISIPEVHEAIAQSLLRGFHGADRH